MSVNIHSFASLLLRHKEPPMHNQHCRSLIDTMKSLSLTTQTLKPLRNPSNRQAERGFAKEAYVYFPYLDSVLFRTVHYATLPFRHSAIPPFRHSAILPFRHSAIPPFRHSTILPFRQSVIPPFHHSAIPPFRHSAIPPFRSNTQ